MERNIKDALKDHGIECAAVVEVDPVENDWLITGVKQVGATPKTSPKIEGHTVPAGKSIIRRLEDLADSDFKRYMAMSGTGKVDELGRDISDGLDFRVEGICEALAIMKNSSRGVEYEAVLDRHQNEIVVGEKRP